MSLTVHDEEKAAPTANVRQRKRKSLNLCNAWNEANAHNDCQSTHCTHNRYCTPGGCDPSGSTGVGNSSNRLPSRPPMDAETRCSNSDNDAPRDLLSDAGISDDEFDDPMLTRHPVVNNDMIKEDAVDSDLEFLAAKELSAYMRAQPCVPLTKEGNTCTQTDIDEGHQFCLYSCPFMTASKEYCTFDCFDRDEFLHHVCAGVSDATHSDMVQLFIFLKDAASRPLHSFLRGSGNLGKSQMAAARLICNTTSLEPIVSSVQ